MIQFNLLPDIKIHYIKARRTKRLVTLISIGLSGLSIFVLLLSIVTVDVVQKKALRDLDSDIQSNSKQLKAVPNIDKILTVQNQLNTLTDLHDKKPVTSRLFAYVSQLTPDGVTMNSLKIDYTANTLQLTGGASSLDLVNKLVDTLKATTYASYAVDTAGQKAEASAVAYYKEHNKYPNDPSATVKQAFSDIVLTSFGKSASGATYTVDLSFDPVIFSNTNGVILRVPSDTITNTSILFKETGN